MKNDQDKNIISAGNAGKMETTGVKTLLGDPKKAIVKLSIPMIVAMSVQTIYSLIDTYWVSGLGADALAAMGFVFPFFFISMALSNGIGIGGELLSPAGLELRIRWEQTTQQCTR